MRFVADILIVIGLGGFIVVIVNINNISYLVGTIFLVISLTFFMFGLNLIINDVIDDRMKRSDDIDDEIKKIKEHFDPRISWDENGNKLRFDENIGWH